MMPPRPDVLATIRRRGWIVVLVMIVSTSLAFAATSRQQDRYSATAVILVSPAVTDSDAMLTAQQIGDTYRVVIASRGFLGTVADQLGDIDTDTLIGNLSLTSSKPAQFIEIQYTDPDPDRAALVANTIAEMFGAYAAQRGSQLASDAQAVLLDERQALVEQRANIDTLLAQPSEPVATASPVALSNDSLLQERAAVQDAIDRIDERTLAFQEQSAIAHVSIETVETAEAPEDPAEPSVVTAALLGLVGGFIAGVVILAIVIFLESAPLPPRDEV